MKKLKQKLKIIFVPLALIALLLSWPIYSFIAHSVDVEIVFREVKKGMTMNEVIAITGKDPVEVQYDNGLEDFRMYYWGSFDSTVYFVFEKGKLVSFWNR